MYRTHEPYPLYPPYVPRKHTLREPAKSKCTWTFDKALWCGNLPKNAGPQSRGHRFVRACAVETHMDISQEPFYVEIYRKNAARAN